jgi:hypothetical protein
MSKVPIDTIPVEIRIKIYELGDVSDITGMFTEISYWTRTILMSGILNDKDAIEIAAIQGDDTREIMCEFIALSGNLPMMKWARSDKSSARKDEAAETGRSMKHIRLTPFPWNTVCCSNAAEFGHFKLLQWLHEQGCPWNSLTFSYGARFGCMKMLEWLYQKKCPWDKLTCEWAAESGKLDVIKWLHERNCPWDAETLTSAVGTGNLEMVQWLHQQNCPWNERTCAEAAMIGKLDILVWLRERGCPWDDETLANAYASGRDEILSWAVLNGCPNYRARRTYDYDPYLDGSEEDYVNSDYDWSHAEEESEDPNDSNPDDDGDGIDNVED